MVSFLKPGGKCIVGKVKTNLQIFILCLLIYISSVLAKFMKLSLLRIPCTSTYEFTLQICM
jgi:hypothetical protein